MGNVIFGLIFIVVPLAILVLSVKYRKIGGIISAIGYASLQFSVLKRAVYLVVRKFSSIGFPVGVETNIDAIKPVQTSTDSTMLWIIISAVVLLVGVVWLIVELINDRRRAHI